jgi:hypothetical protein
MKTSALEKAINKKIKKSKIVDGRMVVELSKKDYVAWCKQQNKKLVKMGTFK